MKEIPDEVDRDGGTKKKSVCLRNMADKKSIYHDTLHNEAVDPMPCSRALCKGNRLKSIYHDTLHNEAVHPMPCSGALCKRTWVFTSNVEEFCLINVFWDVHLFCISCFAWFAIFSMIFSPSPHFRLVLSTKMGRGVVLGKQKGLRERAEKLHSWRNLTLRSDE